MTQLIFVEVLNAASNAPEQHALRAIDLPDSQAVRNEVAAMLENAERAAPARPRRTDRLRDWVPRWIGWLRAMPMP